MARTTTDPDDHTADLDQPRWQLTCDCGDTWTGPVEQLHQTAVSHSQTCNQNRYAVTAPSEEVAA